MARTQNLRLISPVRIALSVSAIALAWLAIDLAASPASAAAATAPTSSHLAGPDDSLLGGLLRVDSVAPIVDDVVTPVTQSVVEPVVSEVVSPVLDAVVTPVVHDVAIPVLADVVAPVVAVASPVLTPVVDSVVAPVTGGILPVPPVTPDVVDVSAPSDFVDGSASGNPAATAADTAAAGIAASAAPGLTDSFDRTTVRPITVPVGTKPAATATQGQAGWGSPLPSAPASPFGTPLSPAALLAPAGSSISGSGSGHGSPVATTTRHGLLAAPVVRFHSTPVTGDELPLTPTFDPGSTPD